MNTPKIEQTKKELIIAAYTAPNGSRIQVFRNKKGEITYSRPMFGSSYSPDPENIRKEDPDTIGWVNSVTLSELNEGIAEHGAKAEIELDAETWSDWAEEFGPAVQGEYYEKAFVLPNLETLLDKCSDLVTYFDFGFDLEATPRAEEQAEEAEF